MQHSGHAGFCYPSNSTKDPGPGWKIPQIRRQSCPRYRVWTRKAEPDAIGIGPSPGSAAGIVWDLDQFPWPLESAPSRAFIFAYSSSTWTT